ncbi:MAG: hypothetical protein JRJ12_04875 [Deltaproteobacteria bacterium]|nr:hypothetical protein [Deltaproteobacteria bacterium]MBW2072153.1 hypothetical protein [Deltaproteobacteria bacterium]
MTEEKKPTTEYNSTTDEERATRAGLDGMGTATARIEISRSLRKKILQEYDLVDLENKGRYYAAKAYSKDGRWFNELLIDKQTGNIQVMNRQEIRKGKER